jgi:hypothetical protein
MLRWGRRGRGADLAEIEAVYRRRLGELRRVAAAITGDRESACDVVQEAFVNGGTRAIVLSRGRPARRLAVADRRQSRAQRPPHGRCAGRAAGDAREQQRQCLD